MFTYEEYNSSDHSLLRRVNPVSKVAGLTNEGYDKMLVNISPIGSTGRAHVHILAAKYKVVESRFISWLESGNTLLPANIDWVHEGVNNPQTLRRFGDFLETRYDKAVINEIAKLSVFHAHL